ncbi:class 1 fructose-bisphosphatase [Candidatus Magnetominusculus xianensis]|uniref:Fructose-1,6-bisphosphatase class 1 n=1 Tax=Candidatus Magnetominusculus xianensis TaxID=1748249 RepID=A0ABR5SFB4_9BACT|nr:class 1 fructose-bisphosphatase [Candidatus Magnetominusculus xianensis]KWT83505.1 fructose 1,6-bisphosphatase [Candidatus Magnetominusculus xianensis]MBF0405603.1 class 1 fructose-bisphosphatase [Nitrospirota bacterium]
MPNIGMDLNRYILEEERKYPSATGSLSIALMAIETATKIIASHVRMAGLAEIFGKAMKTNIQGEEVQKLDEFANNVLIRILSDSGHFYALASEELDEVIFPEKGTGGKYIVAFDPLDGSSNIEVNVSIGTIFSIYRKNKGTAEDFLQGGDKQIAAGYVIYGSSSVFAYTTGTGLNAFTLDPSVGLFLLSHKDMKIPESGKIYSVNESNSKGWDKRIRDYFDTLKDEGYTARFSGTMVADVHRTLLKGGVFAYPADAKSKKGKLRLLYEVLPMSMIVEQAGGMSTEGKGDLLQAKPEEIHSRTPVFMGSRKEIVQLMNTQFMSK